MKRNTSDEILRYAEYYIWWLLNCPHNVPKKQIQKEVDGVIDQLQSLHLQNEAPIELQVLKEIQSFEYDILYYVNVKELDNFLDEELRIQLDEEMDDYYRRF